MTPTRRGRNTTRTEQVQRLRAIWTQTDPEAEIAVAACTSQRALRKLKHIAFGDGIAEQAAALLVRQLAHDIERLNGHVDDLEAQLADLLAAHGNRSTTSAAPARPLPLR